VLLERLQLTVCTMAKLRAENTEGRFTLDVGELVFEPCAARKVSVLRFSQSAVRAVAKLRAANTKGRFSLRSMWECQDPPMGM